MKTTKTLLALIAVAAMVACSKDDISYGDLNGTYELTKIVYSFDGKTIDELTLEEAYNEDIWYVGEKLKFEGQNVTIWEYGEFYAIPFALDGDWISFFGDIYRIDKTSRTISLYWYTYLDYFDIDEEYNPVYDEEWLADADKSETFNGREIHYDTSRDDYEIAFYYKNGKPVFCDTYDDENWYDRIEYIYKKN